MDSRFGGIYLDMDHAVVAKEGSNGLIITIVHCCWLTIRRLQEGAVAFFGVQSITKEEDIFDLPLLHYFPLKLWRCHAFRIFNLSTFPTNMWLSCDYAQVAHEWSRESVASLQSPTTLDSTFRRSYDFAWRVPSFHTLALGIVEEIWNSQSKRRS